MVIRLPLFLLTVTFHHVVMVQGRISSTAVVVDQSTSQVHTHEADSAIIERPRQQRGLIGERCGLFFNAECVEGTICVKAAIGGGRCMPIECITDAIRQFNEQHISVGRDVQTVTDQIFVQAGVTPEQLALSRANEGRSDQTFRQDSSAMQAVVEVMQNMDNPFPELQRELEACSNLGDIENGYENNNNSSNNDESATPGQTMYYGFHLEGGVLYDGEFSVLVAFQGGQPNLTFIRGCFGGGGAGIEVSAVIGWGFTGAPRELLGCSALLTDFEAGAVFAAGVDVGVTFPGVLYVDITLGLGAGGEGFGIGLCGNWQV